MKPQMFMVLLWACAPDVGSIPLDAPNVDAYEALHPYLEARCATLDCHGDEGRPLRLYAETGLRLPGVDRDLPVTAEELEANAWSLVGVDPGSDSERSLVFLKPLDRSEGGMEHVGEDVFTRGSAEAECLSWWLDGAADPSGIPSCEAAEMRWMLPE